MRCAIRADFNYNILGVTQEYGLTDSQRASSRFAVELYEADILTDQDLPGFPTTPGEIFYLVEKIVRRKGWRCFSPWCLLGRRQTVRAPRHSIIIPWKNLSNCLSSWEGSNYPYFLMYATGERWVSPRLKGPTQSPIADKEREGSS